MHPTRRWLILQLSENCDLGQYHNAIANEIKNSFGDDAVYYLPIRTEAVDDKKVNSVLFDGYVFVKCVDEEILSKSVSKLSGSYFRPLTYGGKYQFAKDSDIDNFSKTIEKKIESRVPNMGETIIPKEGVFKDLSGTVLSINMEEKTVTALFKMISREVTATIKFINLG